MSVRLVECRRGDKVRIVTIDAGRGAALDLMNMGLTIGATIHLLRRSPLRGPLLVSHGGIQVAIGYHMAEKILVEKA
ncbi:MAG: ferrous iron transport protein A [Vicinamibacterales bacterium]